MSNPDRPARPWQPLRVLLRKLRLPWPVRPSGQTEPSRPDRRDIEAARLRAQVRVIRKAFEAPIGVATREGPKRPRDDAEASYLYRPGHALVREEHVDQVIRFFDERTELFEGGVDRAGDPTRGLVLLSLPRRTDRQDDVLATLEEMDRELGPGTVTPDHVIYITRARMCPATEPEEPKSRRPWPPPSTNSEQGSKADQIRVAVVDSGLWTDAVGSPESPWLEPGAVLADPSDIETVNPAAIHPYAGHGTFVAGVVCCMAPDTRVEVEGVLTHGGAVYESEIVQQLHEALEDDDHPQLISISAGTHTRNDFGLLAFEMLAAAHGLDDGEETLVVAAAGNDASDERFWPAAFPWVVAVGSVDATGAVSDFSNVGPDWVDVYARGRDLVNAFPKGSYTCYEPPNVGQVRHFHGLAQWSGTSFSTPIVTGLIAARMRATGESAGTAWASVKAAGTPRNDPRGGPITIVGPLT